MIEQITKNKTAMYIAIGVGVFLCCCCLAAVIVYFGYDSWGDPLGIYGSLRQLKSLPIA